MCGDDLFSIQTFGLFGPHRRNRADFARLASSFANFETRFVFAYFSCHGAKPALRASKTALSCRQKRKGGDQRAPGALFLATWYITRWRGVGAGFRDFQQRRPFHENEYCHVK